MERTVTFVMEDALISPVGLAILTGADVIDATEDKPIIQHIVENVEVDADGKIYVQKVPYNGKAAENWIYVMKCDANNDPESEPYIYTGSAELTADKGYALVESSTVKLDSAKPKAGDIVLVDYYTARKSGAHQIDITPDSFGGNFYLEASTLFRDTNGVDLPAEFIIPNCKIQSNFTFSMASSGDPSTFTFTLDAFPDYTRFEPTKKVLSAIQVITDDDAGEDRVSAKRKITDDSSPITTE